MKNIKKKKIILLFILINQLNCLKPDITVENGCSSIFRAWNKLQALRLNQVMYDNCNSLGRSWANNEYFLKKLTPQQARTIIMETITTMEEECKVDKFFIAALITLVMAYVGGGIWYENYKQKRAKLTLKQQSKIFQTS